MIGELVSSWLLRTADANCLTFEEITDALVSRDPLIRLGLKGLDFRLTTRTRKSLALFAHLRPAQIRSLELQVQMPNLPEQWILRFPVHLQGDRHRWPASRARYAFCSRCLVEMHRDDGYIWIPADWACATVTHCRRHRTPLLERCPSCFVSDPLRAISDSTTGHIRCRRCDGSLLLHNREEPTTPALAKVMSLEESIMAALRGKPADPYWCAKLSATEFIKGLAAMVNSLTCGDSDSGFLLVVEGDAQWEEHLRGRQSPEASFPVFSWRWRLLLMGSLVELLEDRKMSTG
jgi:hypothetical protein